MASVTPTHRFGSERGAELIEFALIVPLLLFIIMGLIDFGFMFQRYEVVTNAAREGARLGVLPGYEDVANVTDRIQSYLDAGGVPTTGSNPAVSVTDVSVPVAGGPAVPCRRVEVSYTSPYLFIGPLAGWFGGTFTTATLTAVAVMRYEVP
jgi:Flp pilus assembly protein TadG